MFLRLIDDGGNTYYYAYNAPARLTDPVPEYTVKADQTGKVVATVNGAADVIKQIGDKIYVLQKGGRDENNQKLKGITCKVYDTDFKLLETYRMSYASLTQYTDVNSEKVCYLSNNKIYLRNLDGKNQKMLYDLSSGELKGGFCQGLALTEDYVGVTVNKNDNNGKTKSYCVVINLKSGKVQVEEQPLLSIPKAFGNQIIWNSANDPDGPLFSGSKQLVILENEELKTMKTSTDKEALNSIAADSDGKIITRGYSNDEGWVKIYENGKATKKIVLPSAACVALKAEKGVIAYCYEEMINGKYYLKTELIPY